MLGSNFYLKAVKTKIYIYVHFLFPKSRGSNMWCCDWKPPPPTQQRHCQTLERLQRERDSSLAPFSRFLDFHSQRLIFHCFIPFNKSLSNSLSEKEKMEFVNTHFDVKQTAMAFLDSHSHLKSSRKAKKY